MTDNQSQQATVLSRSWGSSQRPDAEIVSLVLGGNSAAYEAIMRRYNRLLFRLVRGIVASDADASDVLQECYVRAYFKLSQFRGPDGFASWISRIAINEALQRMRDRSVPLQGGVEADELPAGARYRPEQAAMSRDTMEMIETAIAALPSNFRVVFLLRGVEGLSVSEVAELLDLNPATVKTRFHRARTQLKRSLGEVIEEAVPRTFSFAGDRCDSIVSNVFRRIAATE